MAETYSPEDEAEVKAAINRFTEFNEKLALALASDGIDPRK